MEQIYSEILSFHSARCEKAYSQRHTNYWRVARDSGKTSKFHKLSKRAFTFCSSKTDFLVTTHTSYIVIVRCFKIKIEIVPIP